MSERPRSAESPELQAATRFLIDRMKAGERIDSTTFGELVGVLKAYQGGEYQQQPVRRPAASGYVVEAKHLPMPAPVVTGPMPPARVQSRTIAPPVAAHTPDMRRPSSEAFLEKEPWSLFRSEVAKREFAVLSEDERTFVLRGAEILKEEIAAYQMLSVKAIGANVRQYSHDYGGRDILKPSDPSFSWEGWESYFKQSFSPDEKALVSDRPYSRNFIFATTAHGLRERGLAFLSLHLWTPQNTSQTDNRGISHNAALFIKNGRFMQLLRSGKMLRLLPFIVKVAGIQVNPQEAVFFDGSFAGDSAPFGKAANPIATAIQEAGQSSVFLDSDTRIDHPSESLYSGPNSKSFLSSVFVARGNADRGDPARFRLRPSAPVPKDLPRL
jgi:hypothetical protein